MNELPFIIWGIACFIAAGGCVLVFRAEHKQDELIIEQQHRSIRHLQGELNLEKAAHNRTKARLSQLMPVPEDIVRRQYSNSERNTLADLQRAAHRETEARIEAREAAQRMKERDERALQLLKDKLNATEISSNVLPLEQPYDQTKDRGPTTRIDPFEKEAGS